MIIYLVILCVIYVGCVYTILIAAYRGGFLSTTQTDKEENSLCQTAYSLNPHNFTQHAIRKQKCYYGN